MGKAVLPEDLTKVGDYAFKEATFDHALEIPEGVEEVGKGAFSYTLCKDSLYLPDPLKRIGEHAFDAFDSAQDLVVPAAVTTIGAGAFQTANAVTGMKVTAHKNAEGYEENLKALIPEEQLVDLCERHIEEAENGAKACAVCGYVEKTAENAGTQKPGTGKEEGTGTQEPGTGDETGTGTKPGTESGEETGTKETGESGDNTGNNKNDESLAGGSGQNGNTGEEGPATGGENKGTSDYSQMKVEQAGTGFSAFTTDKVIDGKNNMAFGFYPPDGDQGVTLKAIITGITEEQRAKLHFTWTCLETMETIETAEPEFILTRAQLLENTTSIQQRNFAFMIDAEDAENSLYDGFYSVSPMTEGQSITPLPTEDLDPAPNGDEGIEPEDDPSGTEDRGQDEKPEQGQVEKPQPGQEPEGQNPAEQNQSGQGDNPNPSTDTTKNPLAEGSGNEGNPGGEDEGSGTKEHGTGDGTGTEDPGTNQETGTGEGNQVETGTSPEARVPVSPAETKENAGTKPAGQEGNKPKENNKPLADGSGQGSGTGSDAGQGEHLNSDPIVTPRDTEDKPKPGSEDVAKTDPKDEKQEITKKPANPDITEEAEEEDEEHLPWPVIPAAAAATAGAGTVLLLFFWFRRRNVRGLVVDKKGRPQQGIYFTMEGPDDLDASTDGKGAISFRNLKKGTYALTAYNRKDEAILVATIATDAPKEEAVEIMQSSVKTFDFEKRGRRTVFKIAI